MCGPYFNFAASPKASEYHVHIYFDAQDAWERMQAQTLARELLHRFPGKVSGGQQVGKVGPHTRHNIEVDIKPEAFGEVVQALQMNSQGLSVLIHPRTGDELFDHQSAALWLGKPVPFNEKFFEQVLAQQSGQAIAPRRPKFF